jgi:hypothetical protein
MRVRGLPSFVAVGVLCGAALATDLPWAPAITKVPIMLRAERLHWRPALAGLPHAVKVASLEGDPTIADMFTIRLTVPAGTLVGAHWHSQAYRGTVISGSLFMGYGNDIVKEHAEELPTGTFWASPAGDRHAFFTKQDTIVQITAMGPWDISYVSSADDPRKANIIVK